MNNLHKADRIAQRGKAKQTGVIQHNKKAFANLQTLQTALITKTFVTSPYETFKIREPKERTIYKLPYFPDRILHHAIMNILEPVFMSVFTADTYSCIKGRGVHLAVKKIKAALADSRSTTYCLKLDIKKFYPSVDHAVLKQMLRRKFKDADLLQLLDGIIDSTEGLPIGNYLSQFLANYYLTPFDHWLKEQKQVRYYFRYADDMVILSNDKAALHQLLQDIKNYLHTELKLEVKNNHQVFPVADRGIDFLGYRIYHSYSLLRKRIKKNFIRKFRGLAEQPSIASYLGWAKHCNSRHLLKRLNKGGGYEVAKTKPSGELPSI